MLLRKSLSLTDCEIKMDGDTGRFAGYASVFGGVDSHGDTILKGAFDTTLRRDGKPKMFYGHDSFAGIPIGKWLSAKEDDKGLFVEGELTPGVSLAEDVRAALKHGTLDGLSIGGNHLIHAMRRNIDLKILLFNNRIYGLTKGQTSPTSEQGKKTKSTPFGALDRPFNPLSVAIGSAPRLRFA